MLRKLGRTAAAVALAAMIAAPSVAAAGPPAANPMQAIVCALTGMCQSDYDASLKTSRRRDAREKDETQCNAERPQCFSPKLKGSRKR